MDGREGGGHHVLHTGALLTCRTFPPTADFISQSVPLTQPNSGSFLLRAPRLRARSVLSQEQNCRRGGVCRVQLRKLPVWAYRPTSKQPDVEFTLKQPYSTTLLMTFHKERHGCFERRWPAAAQWDSQILPPPKENPPKKPKKTTKKTADQHFATRN